MVCGHCGAAIAQVSGKSGGYYGCLEAAKGVCENGLLVRRTLSERVIVAHVRDKLASSEKIEYVLKRVEQEIARTYSDIPETIRIQEFELQVEERRVANFVEFIGEGRGSKALAEALSASERRGQELRGEFAQLRRHREVVFKAPPRVWVEERVAILQKVLERRTQKSALLLRKLLGRIRLQPTRGDIGRPYYVARSNLQVLTLLEEEPDDPEDGSNTLHWWTRSQRIRPAGETSFEPVLLETVDHPAYESFPEGVNHLNLELKTG